MNEQELKKKANELRHEIEERKKALRDLFDKLRIHNQDARKFRKKRDSLNDDLKGISIKLKDFKEKRDKLNKAVSELKSSRRKFAKDIKSMSSGVNDSRKLRDGLNQSSRSTEELLEKVLTDKLETLLGEEIRLGDEKRLFNLVLSLTERLKSAREATIVHNKIVEDIKAIDGISSKFDSMGDQLTGLSNAADEYHTQVVEVYDEIKVKREESNQAHERLIDKYKEIDPLRKQVTSLKNEVAKLREEIEPVNDALNDIRAAREDKKRKELASQAKEKLKSSKRLSLDDLRMILGEEAKDKKA